MKRLVSGLSVLVCVVAMAACGGGSSGGGKKNSAPNKGPNGEDNSEVGGNQSHGGQATCDASWQKYVQANPQGRAMEYETRSEQQMAGMPSTGPGNVTTSKETIVESNNDRVTTRTESSNNTNDSTMTRDDWMKYCKAGGSGGTGGTQGQVTVLEQRKESITVRAGRFDAQYAKVKLGSGAGNGTSETWTAGSDSATYVVKSITVMEQTAGGYVIKQVITKELTHIVQP